VDTLVPVAVLVVTSLWLVETSMIAPTALTRRHARILIEAAIACGYIPPRILAWLLEAFPR
jgi:hypothetical protein